MIVHTRTVIDIETGAVLHDESYIYSGPAALCNRAAQKQGSQAAATDATTGATYNTEAQAQLNALTPILEQRMTAQHLYTPGQENELLTSIGAGAGGATGALESQAELEHARTNQQGNTGAVLDAMQRNKAQALAKGSENVAAQDVQGAIRQQQQATEEMGSLYGQTSENALKSMGLENQAINTEIAAGNSGWFQNLTGLVGAAAKASKGPMSWV